jgi:hypothetical protein
MSRLTRALLNLRDRSSKNAAIWKARIRDHKIQGRPHFKLAVAAIFRDEAPFLEEWLSFHEGVGVEHFYLYNNFSTDDYERVLVPWIGRGCVSLHDWPVAAGQLKAYLHCVNSYADSASRIAFIDIDEFLFSPLQTDIRPIIDEYRELPGLHVYSPFFGSCGHLERPSGSQLEAFTRRAELSFGSAKTIANPRWIRAISNAHIFEYWREVSRDTDRRPLIFGQMGSVDKLRVNHYWSRSIADLEQKVRRGDASTCDLRQREWHLNN